MTERISLRACSLSCTALASRVNVRMRSHSIPAESILAHDSRVRM